MIVGQSFLPDSFAFSERREIRLLPELISPQGVTELTQYLLYEAPIISPQFIILIAKPSVGEFCGSIVDLSGGFEETDFQDGGVLLPGRIWSNAPRLFEKLMENAAAEMLPFMKDKAYLSGLAKVWADQPEIYNRYIDKRKNPGEINRQNSYIIFCWDFWERRKISLKECVAIMKGEGFGDLTPTNLQKRAERLGLSANSGSGDCEPRIVEVPAVVKWSQVKGYI